MSRDTTNQKLDIDKREKPFKKDAADAAAAPGPEELKQALKTPQEAGEKAAPQPAADPEAAAGGPQPEQPGTEDTAGQRETAAEGQDEAPEAEGAQYSAAEKRALMGGDPKITMRTEDQANHFSLGEAIGAVDIDQIQENGRLVKAILYKNPYSSYFGVAFGVVICLLKSTWAIVLGGIFAALSLATIVLVKDHKVMDIYDDAMIIYADETGTKAARIPYERVVEWESILSTTNSYTLKFTLDDGTVFFKDTFQLSKAYNALMKIMPDKEHRQIQIKKNQENSVSFKDALKNIGRSIRRLFGKK
jgi:hypothetical protein